MAPQPNTCEPRQGARFRFRFCLVCGTTVFHTAPSVAAVAGAFADPDYPQPELRVYGRRHSWVQLPPGITFYDKDPG